MKYVRTSEGKIAEVKKGMLVKETFLGQKYLVYEECPMVAVIDSDGDLGTVVEEADIIEELCDEFVEISPYNPLHLFYGTFNEAKTMSHCGYVFGMNWVFDKNNVPTLKAVAKMNVTGELELIV